MKRIAYTTEFVPHNSTNYQEALQNSYAIEDDDDDQEGEYMVVDLSKKRNLKVSQKMKAKDLKTQKSVASEAETPSFTEVFDTPTPDAAKPC